MKVKDVEGSVTSKSLSKDNSSVRRFYVSNEEVKEITEGVEIQIFKLFLNVIDIVISSEQKIM